MLYKTAVEFTDQGTIGATKLSWSYTGQSKTVIPASAYSYIGYTSSSPITVQVNPLCGNSKRTSGEEWDDGNIVDGDGWNSSCLIESNYTWTGGSENSKDICTKILKQNNESISEFASASSWTMIGFLIIGSILNTIQCFSSGYSSGSIFTIMNQIQLIMLLPMLPNFMNKDVELFIISFNFCLFNFNFIQFPPESLKIDISLDYDQPNSYLSMLKIDSGSGIVNLMSNISGVGFMIMFHGLLYMTIILLNKCKIDNRFSTFINKWFKRMTFGWYLQCIIWSYLMIVMISASEVFRYDWSQLMKIISLALSFFILVIEIKYLN